MFSPTAPVTPIVTLFTVKISPLRTLNWSKSSPLFVLARLAASGRDPQRSFATGERILRETLTPNDRESSEVLHVLAELHRWRAEWRGGHRLSVASEAPPGT